MSNLFYRYDPSQCILCGQCVQACQTVEVNETLSIGWELDHPRVLWDGGMQIGGSSCVSCGHCITVCPCNALMEKSMLGEAGFLSGMPKDALNKMIDVVKAVEPEMGYGAIMQVSQTEAKMREERSWMRLARKDHPTHITELFDRHASSLCRWMIGLHRDT